MRPANNDLSVEEILKMEMASRVELNALQREREACEAKCREALERLNYYKRQAYAAGFKGNIMRDENGNRVNKLLPNKE